MTRCPSLSVWIRTGLAPLLVGRIAVPVHMTAKELTPLLA